MRIFVTGATGFAGSHLVEQLLAAGHDVYGLLHAATSHQPQPVHANYHSVPGDLLALSALKQVLAEIRPDLIYHLAGQASPARSWDDPALTLAINSGGTANILEAARASGKPKLVTVTSAHIYSVERVGNLPITEETTPSPEHPYGVSKWTASQLAKLYWRQHRLPVVEARPFNHIGPRQALGFVVPDFSSQLAEIRLGLTSPEMTVGNLEAERDFTDVRDVVRAYVLLAERGRPGETYLICSGQAVSIRRILDYLIEIADVDVKISQDPARLRQGDVPRLVGSNAKIARDTGWQPEIELRTSLIDTFQEWLAKLEK